MDELLSNVLMGVPDVMSSFRQPNKWQHKNNAQNTSNFLVKLDPLKNAGRDFPNGQYKLSTNKNNNGGTKNGRNIQ